MSWNGGWLSLLFIWGCVCGMRNGWDFVTGLDGKGVLMIRISTAVNTHFVLPCEKL